MRINIDVDFDNVNYDEIEEVEDITLYDSIDEYTYLDEEDNLFYLDDEGAMCYPLDDEGNKITLEFDIIE